MDALEFAKELKRMCDAHNQCSECDIHEKCVGRSLISLTRFEEIIIIVEKWSKEHPKATNLDHYAEELERIGFKVDKEYLREYCPIHLSNEYTGEDCQVEGTCDTCKEWWDEEYKEQKHD